MLCRVSALAFVLLLDVGLPVPSAAAPMALVVRLAAHAPILIASDADFTSGNGVVAGTGTPSNPYVISGWSIDANLSTGILVRNTTAWFTIRDSFIHGGTLTSESVRFENVLHARVANLTVVHVDGVGVNAFGSTDVNVSSSAFRTYAAIRFHNSQLGAAYNNTVAMDLYGVGVVLYRSSRVSVVGNRISGGNWGVYVSSSDNSTIEANRIASSFLNSLLLVDSSRSISIRGNDLGRAGIGFSVDNADGITITPDNRVRGLPVLYYKDCVGTRVDGLAAGQVILAGCDRVLVSNMTLRGFAGFLTIYSSSHWTLTRNSFFGCCIVHEGVRDPNLYAQDQDYVYLNNFYGSGFEGGGAVIQWDLPYPIGGNYWSDYPGVDRCSGPKQAVCPDPDGIGDTPMPEGIFDVDTLPRMSAVDPNNTAPSPSFTMTPAGGDPSTALLFNASRSSDAQDVSDRLLVRWDWNNDGIWDTSWNRTKIAVHTFGSPGTYVVHLEVLDTAGWLAIGSMTVVIAPLPLGLSYQNWAILLAAVIVVSLVVFLRKRRGRGRQPSSPGPPPTEETAGQPAGLPPDRGF